MLLTESDIQHIQEAIEAGANLDPDLAEQCRPLIRMGSADNAVRNAFVILENRLRKAVETGLPPGKERMTGVAMANFAFSPDGPLAKRIHADAGEKDGLRELFSGAFKALRNPAAHGPISLSITDAKAIIGLVNLLLGILDRIQTDGQPTRPFPPNVLALLQRMRTQYGGAAIDVLEPFLSNCIREGLQPYETPVNGIPFRESAMMKQPNWSAARPYPLPIFYLTGESNKGLMFPVRRFYTLVQGLDTAGIERQLLKLGLQRKGKDQSLFANPQIQNDQEFYERLFIAVQSICKAVKKTVA